MIKDARVLCLGGRGHLCARKVPSPKSNATESHFRNVIFIYN